ncbi:MAG: toxin-antitoxin system HicB family antitoxin [Planctomycetes bacterium]|nr:toxin-antitoxin system HicB family antitoxin [Planctomycetota bacterium]
MKLELNKKWYEEKIPQEADLDVTAGNPEEGGKLKIQLPKSLHGALQREAAEEGVSLNQLVVTKLAMQMSELTAGPRPVTHRND